MTWRHTPLRRYEALIARECPPTSTDYFLAYSRSNLDHHVIYHDLANVAPHLRSAEVLILGNSRTMYAFNRPFVERFESRFHLRCYVLGFGFNEHDLFPSAVIEKFDLHPRWVIVNADGFFSSSLSLAGRHAMRYGRLPALDVLYEGNLSHAVRRGIHRILPHIATMETPEQADWVTYRSVSDGTWFVAAYKGQPSVFSPSQVVAHTISATTIRAADRFASLVRGRGGELILTIVPTPVEDRAGVQQIAARVQAPLIIADPDPVSTIDGSHMTSDCAERFGTLFLDRAESYLMPTSGRPGDATRVPPKPDAGPTPKK